jgi:hypothetical protein
VAEPIRATACICVVTLTLAAAALPRFVRPSVILVAILLYVVLASAYYQALRWEKRTRPGGP